MEFKLHDRYRSSGLVLVLGEPGKTLCLFCVDGAASRLVENFGGGRDRLDANLHDDVVRVSEQVVVPRGIDVRSRVGGENVDEGAVVLVAQVHHGTRVLLAGLGALGREQEERCVTEGCGAAAIRSKLLDDLLVEAQGAVVIGHGVPLVGRLVPL